MDAVRTTLPPLTSLNASPLLGERAQNMMPPALDETGFVSATVVPGVRSPSQTKVGFSMTSGLSSSNSVTRTSSSSARTQ